MAPPARVPAAVVLADAYPHLRGGAQAQLAWLAGELVRRDVDAQVVAPGVGPWLRRLASAGVPTVAIPVAGALAGYGGRLRPAAAARLPAYWWRARYAFGGAAVAHLNDHRGVLLYGPAARLAGAKVVWHVHAHLDGRPARRALDRACAVIAHAVVAPTAAAARDLAGAGARPTVIPGHVPDPGVRWAPGDPPRIACVGRLHPAKGQHDLVEAFARLRGRHPDLRLDLIGPADRPGFGRGLVARSQELGLGDAVQFLGHLDAPWERVATAAVYVQPSRRETQGIALAQALRIGIPVVAADLPAIREQVAPGPGVRLVPPGDPDAMAGAIAELLAGPPRPAAGATPSPGAAEARSWRQDAAIVDAWLQLYAELVAS